MRERMLADAELTTSGSTAERSSWRSRAEPQGERRPWWSLSTLTQLLCRTGSARSTGFSPGWVRREPNPQAPRARQCAEPSSRRIALVRTVYPVVASRCRPRGDRFDSCAETSSGGRAARLGGTAGPCFKLHGFVGWAATLLLLFFVREAAARHSCRAVGTRRPASTAHLRARPRPFARLPASLAGRAAARRLLRHRVIVRLPAELRRDGVAGLRHREQPRAGKGEQCRSSRRSPRSSTRPCSRPTRD